MFSKCILVLLLLNFLEAHSEIQYYRVGSSTSSCRVPVIEHGRARIRQRSGLVMFKCMTRYELVGNRYATCRNGRWDVPMPVCVKSGCDPFTVPNSVQIKNHHDAWVMTLCMPGYRLVGSSALYCNGYRWNGTSPKCVDSSISPSLSCNFEDDLCGWVQDELHDFDWKRINTKTPSSFLATGPSYDHTLGIGKGGYYMYIESTSKLENNTARLLSPIYDSHLADNGCFSFFYHMYGKGTGGLRVYQKPDYLQMSELLLLGDSDKDQYLLWEQWGNQGDFWYSAAPQLKDFNDSFQIVIEGVRGWTFSSDIAIDDVALLQGENCTYFRRAATSPSPPLAEQSCQDRCDQKPSPTPVLGCECHPGCVGDNRCCPDFIELCVFSRVNMSSIDDDGTTEAEQPQTQKLIGSPTTPTVNPTTATSTTTSTTAKPSTTTTTTLSPKTTTELTSTTSTTTTPKPITIAKPTKTTMKQLTTKSQKTSTTPKTTSTVKVTASQTTQKSTMKSTTRDVTKFSTTTLASKMADTIGTQMTQATPVLSKSTKKKTSSPINTTPITFTTLNILEIKKKEKEVSVQAAANMPPARKSSSLKTALVTIVMLAAFAGVIYLVLVSRTARGRAAIARFRGRLSHDTSEVRYLNSNDDDL